jgi:putative transposase
MPLNQDQPIGNRRFYAEIEAMTGKRRELRKRGCPQKKINNESPEDAEQVSGPLRVN